MILRVLQVALTCLSVLAPVSALATGTGETPIQDAINASLSAQSWKAAFDRGFETETNPSGGDEFSLTQQGRKSVFKAALLSAVIPGGGQLYLGHRKKARYFFAAEVLTWVGYASFRMYGDWKRDDYINFAAAHANADLEDKGDEFIDLVGFYSSVHEYNRAGRVTDTLRPFYFDTTDCYWRWQSIEDRLKYRALKNSSRESYRRADFMIGVAVVDRIVSVVEAVRSARRANRRIGESSSRGGGASFKFSVDPFRSSRQVSLTFYPGL